MSRFLLFSPFLSLSLSLSLLLDFPPSTFANLLFSFFFLLHSFHLGFPLFLLLSLSSRVSTFSDRSFSVGHPRAPLLPWFFLLIANSVFMFFSHQRSTRRSFPLHLFLFLSRSSRLLFSVPFSPLLFLSLSLSLPLSGYTRTRVPGTCVASLRRSPCSVSVRLSPGFFFLFLFRGCSFASFFSRSLFPSSFPLLFFPPSADLPISHASFPHFPFDRARWVSAEPCALETQSFSFLCLKFFTVDISLETAQMLEVKKKKKNVHIFIF